MESCRMQPRFISQTDADGNLVTADTNTGVWHKRDREGRLLACGIVRHDAAGLLAAIQRQDEEWEERRKT